MDAPTAPPAAPAQPAASPVPISATRDAANRGSFADFDKAEIAAREGKPLAPIASAPAPAPAEAKPPAAPAPSEEQRVSRRQQEINEHIRRATAAETELARLREENARLKTPPAAPAQPPAAETPAWKRYAALPDAPKIAQFDSVEEHTAAMAHFIATTMLTERDQAAHARTAAESRDAALHETATQFGQRMKAAKEADPEIASKINPDILQARPLSGLTREEAKTASFANAVAEAGLYSEHPAALFTYVSDPKNAAEVVRIAQLPPAQCWDALVRLDGRLGGTSSTITAPAPGQTPGAGASPSPITAAPPPPPTISKAGTTADPQAAALARGDFATWDRLETEKVRTRRGAA